jgi:hypothetical protein
MMSNRTGVATHGSSASSDAGVSSTTLQRQCACGQHMAGGGECEECKKKRTTLQRHPANHFDPSVVPPVVRNVLCSPGQPLDLDTRSLMESRFHRDFSRVRVHTDARAAESARAVNALAYTVRQDIAFGEGQYAPGTEAGRRLLAHELVHTLQQSEAQSFPTEVSSPSDSSEQEANRAEHDFPLHSRTLPLSMQQSLRLHRQIIPVPGSPGGVGLAGPYTGIQAFPTPPPPPPPVPCLVSPDCAKPIPGSAWDFSQKADTEQAQTAKELAASPAKAKAAGAVRPAVELKTFTNKINPSLLTGIYEVIVNPAIGESAGAQAGDCNLAKPQPADPNAACIEVPNDLEKQAQEFNTTQHQEIGGNTRLGWQTETLQTLTHEVAHTKFDKTPPVKQGTTLNTQKVFNYSPDIYLFELSELNSLLSEYPVRYAGVMASTRIDAKDKTAAVQRWIVDYAIHNGDEDLRGMLKKLRCISPCTDVNAGVKKVFASQSAGWTQEQKDLFVATVSDPKQGLNWPK